MRFLQVMLACALVVFVPAPGWAQVASDPSPYELEAWRAASRLDTIEAYRAYLDEFPYGAFARFAQVALAKLRVTQAAAGTAPAASGAAPAASGTPAAAAPSPIALDPSAFRAALKPYSGPLNTGTISMSPGETLIGPGVVTVGWLGAKRQFLVPRGAWTLLVANDHGLAGSSYPAQLTTLVFGQFADNQLRSLLAGTFNRFPIPRRSGPVEVMQANGMLPRWTDIEDCQADRAASAFHASGSTGVVTWCGRMRQANADADQARLLAAVSGDLANALARVGAISAGFQLRSEVYLTDLEFGYLRYVRFDCAEAAHPDAPCATTAASAPALARRVEWMQAFLPLAVQAYRRNIDVADLEPGKAAAAGPLFPPW